LSKYKQVKLLLNSFLLFFFILLLAVYSLKSLIKYFNYKTILLYLVQKKASTPTPLKAFISTAPTITPTISAVLKTLIAVLIPTPTPAPYKKLFIRLIISLNLLRVVLVLKPFLQPKLITSIASITLIPISNPAPAFKKKSLRTTLIIILLNPFNNIS
jgi:hypothetical protein